MSMRLALSLAFWLTLLFALVARAADASAAGLSTRVETRNGPVQGFDYHLPAYRNHRTNISDAVIFLGLPYARPPIDELRLEKPLEPQNWMEPLETTEFAMGCVPHHPLAAFSYDEDCLYLNVFAPKPKSELSGGYPALVFIHGGGFCAGSTSQFGYENVTDNLISQGLIVITMQYRLGPLGWMSNGDREMPGNLGLWDQRLALQWVQSNIARFGGDPTRVTLWGQSAGAASTSMHALSRHSRGLFSQIIIHSGSAYTRWATNEEVVTMSRDLATTLNCDVADSAALKKCIKALDVEDIMEGAAEFPLARDQVNTHFTIDLNGFRARHATH